MSKEIEKIPFEWEELSRTTCRAKVFGGWVVRSYIVEKTRDPGFWATVHHTRPGNALCFIPDPNHEWEFI